MSDVIVAQGQPGHNSHFSSSGATKAKPGLSTVHIFPQVDESAIDAYYTREADKQNLRVELATVAQEYAPQGHKEPAQVEFYQDAGVAIVRRGRARVVDRDYIPEPEPLPDTAIEVDGVGMVDSATGEVLEPASSRRGRIKTFSRKSRKRLMMTINRVRKDSKLPIMVTLTYPDVYPREPERWKRDLQAFLKRLGRKFARPGVLWRLEVVDRKSGTNAGELAPHYHLLVWGVPLSSEFKRWLSRAWYEANGSTDEANLRAGTNVQTIRSYGGMVGYMSKILGRVMAGELAKETQALTERVGRWWGVWYADNVPFGARVIVQLTERAACDAIRYFRRFAGIKSRAYKSLSCFIDVSQWAAKLGWVPI